jgi:hypothetical protein
MSLLNPLGLDATELLAWGVAAHIVADWLLQNHWMASHKADRGGWPQRRPTAVTDYDSPTQALATRMQTRADELAPVKTPPWWNRHPAAYAHAAIHGLALAVLFGIASLPLAVVHLLVDTRAPVAWWARLIRQTQPEGATAKIVPAEANFIGTESYRPLFDVGMLVRMATDQAFHVATIMVAALLIGAAA